MLITAGLALAGSGLQMQAQNDAIKKQQRIAAAAEENQNRRQSQQQNMVLDEAAKFDPNARADSMEKTAQAAEASLGSAIAGANSAAPQHDAAATGRVSDEYKTAQASAVADQIQKAAESARLMSRVRAPSDMLATENMNYADMLGRVGTVGSKAKGEWSRDMAIKNSVTPNSGMMLLGDALKAGGTIFGGGAASPGGFSLF